MRHVKHFISHSDDHTHRAVDTPLPPARAQRKKAAEGRRPVDEELPRPRCSVRSDAGVAPCERTGVRAEAGRRALGGADAPEGRLLLRRLVGVGGAAYAPSAEGRVQLTALVTAL